MRRSPNRAARAKTSRKTWKIPTPPRTASRSAVRAKPSELYWKIPNSPPPPPLPLAPPLPQLFPENSLVIPGKSLKYPKPPVPPTSIASAEYFRYTL